MNDNLRNVFERHTDPTPSPSKPSPQLEVIKGGKQPYKAYGADAPKNRSRFLDIDYGNGQVGGIAKAYFTEWCCTEGKMLSLLFTTCVIEIEGEHLEKIVEMLREDTLGSIHCFRPKHHEPPAEGQAIITKIRHLVPKEPVEEE